VNPSIEIILKQYRFNIDFAEKSVADIPQEMMSENKGHGLENHPSFTLGHLAIASAMTVEDLGGTYHVPEGWHELFARKGPGDPRLPDPDLNVYPSKEILLRELKEQHLRVEIMLKSMDDAALMKSFSWRFNNYFPTLLDLVTFMCISHESMHLSQLSAWRRAMGFPSALALL
jgi:hypothetical protein